MESKSPEKIKPKQNNTGDSINFSQRMERMWNDPKVKESTKAFGRTISNLGISLSDLVPGGPGEILDAIALVGKKIQFSNKDKSTISFDLTPDVASGWINFLANAPEVFTAGAFPSYAIPTGMQLIKDVPRMVEGTKQAIKILKNEEIDYHTNQTEIDNAIEVFSTK